MNNTQIALGVALLGVGTVTFASPDILGSPLLVSLLAVVSLFLAGSALIVGTVHSVRHE